MSKTYIQERDGFVIRLAKAEDADNYYNDNYCPLDKDIVRYTGCKEEFTKEEVQSFFLKSLKDNNRYFFLIISPEGRIIGESVINEIDWKLRCANFRIAIFHPSARGHGIGTWATEFTRDFAFQELKLHRLELDVFSFNPRAEKAYLKAGFKREGILKDAIMDGGQYADDILMAMLEDEWKMIKMADYTYIKLREKPELKEEAALWFHQKWGVPTEAYMECMEAYLAGETEYGWYLCLDGEHIVAGMGVIENDFHDRKDLAPNVCAVYTEEDYRCKGIAGKLLNMVVEDMKEKGISPLYLVTGHTGFYERYGWEFLCMVQGDGEDHMSRMYIHRG